MSYFQNRKNAFRFALQGLKTFFGQEAHPKVHLAAAVFVVLLAWYLNVSKMEWLVLILTIALVLAVEAVNSALEKLTDLASPEINPLAKEVKDMAAGAVLLAAIAAVAVGGIIFIPKILAWF